MKKRNLSAVGQAVSLLLTACLLSGCAALLERSYSAKEPYADRYWDSGAEDTLRVDSYQDLVNSLLMLIEQHAEEGVIRCYGEAGAYKEAMAAREEVRRETMLGAYLLRDLRISYESGASYSTVTCSMTYREDAEDMAAIMVLSDSQSLVDLLRLSVREEREKLTARFSYDTPREDVTAAVESFWEELCRQEMEANPPEPELPPETDPEETDPLTDAPEASPEDAPEDTPEEEPGPQKEEGSSEETPEEEPGEPSEGETTEEPDLIQYPPCPWLVRFYPDRKTAEIVEVILQP